MKLRRIFGLETPDEKIARYKDNLALLQEIKSLGESYSEEFAIQKSIVDGIDDIPDGKRAEVLKNFAAFSKSHAKRVGAVCSKRARIIKEMAELENDAEVADAIKSIKTLALLREALLCGKMSREKYFDIQKAITGKPVRYSDVIVSNSRGQILILHRCEDGYPTGQVCVPGGHVDEGEDFETAALRELKEETNLTPSYDRGILELGEHKDKDVHIKYYRVWVDDATQPVTVDGEEHCFSEWIDETEIPLKNFIFTQGENVFRLLMGEPNFLKLKPILEAYDEGKASGLVVRKSIRRVLKTMNVAAAAPLMPESLEGATKCVVTVRDPNRMIEKVMKSIQGASCVYVNDTPVEFTTPLTVIGTEYVGEPEKNLMLDAEIVFNGAQEDMVALLNELKFSVKQGGVKFKNAQEEFMSVNSNGTDYVGTPIFLAYEK